MNDADFAEINRKVNHLHDTWRSVIGIAEWRGQLAVERETSGKEIHGDFVESMHVQVEWPYMKYMITVNALEAAALSERELEDNIVHELSHVLVAQIVTGDTDQQDHERVTQMVTNALRWTRDQAVKEPFGVLRSEDV